MKKIYMILVLAITFATTVSAQNYSVTFAVDVNNLTSVSTDGIHIAGDFQAAGSLGANWSPADGVMSDDDGNGVWFVTVMLPAGTYAYKYINGNAWGDNEGTGLDNTCSIDDGAGNINRTVTISSDTLVGVYFYDECNLSSELLSSTHNFESVTSFKVSPNPLTSVSILEIENAKSDTHNIIITNITGKVIKTINNVRNNRIELNRDELQTGLYFITVINEKGQKGTRKLMVN